MQIDVGNSTLDMVFLKADVKIEPLICRWYAWSHLISPAQFALHLNFRMLPLLKSFSANPWGHISANSDPKMYGGPFMSLSEEDISEVNDLITDTTNRCAKLITLANDFRSLDELIQEQSTGYSLSSLYDTLPESLQGLVELLYDTNNHACIRLMEEFFYDDDLTSQMQEIFLQCIGELDRQFFMSTPRLRSPGSLSLKMKFSDQRLDALSSMRTKAGSFATIARELEILEEELAVFRSFFTTHCPALTSNQQYAGNSVRMRSFGHACVLFQSSDVSILFDPFVAIEPGNDGRFSLNDLPDFIDYVILSHSHQDHFSAEMLIQLRHRIRRIIVPANNSGAIADPSMKLCLMNLGFTNIDVLSPSEKVEIPGGVILSLPFVGEHADLNVYSKHTISLTLKDRNFLFLVDSDGRDPVLYRRMVRRIGKVDALFIGMECHGAPLNWLYEPLLTMPISRRNNESRRLSGATCDRAWKVIGEIGPAHVYVYAMGQDPWMKYIMGLEYAPDSIQLVESDKLLSLCKEHNIPAEKLACGREALY